MVFESSKNFILGSITDLKPLDLEIIASWESSAFMPSKTRDSPIAFVRKAQIDPSKMGVESITDSPIRVILNRDRYMQCQYSFCRYRIVHKLLLFCNLRTN